MTDKLARIEPHALAAPNPYVPTTFDQLMVICENIAKSRLFGVTTAAHAFVILAAGHELGLSQIQSLRAIHVIDGKPSPSADAIAAIVVRSGLAEYFREVATTEEQSTWETKRRGDPPRRYTYTINDAIEAGLVRPNSNWVRYRKRMLSARAKAFLGRDTYPDLMLGIFTVEELSEPATPAIEIEASTPSPAAPAPVEIIDPNAVPTGSAEQAEQLRGLISAATADELPRISELVRLNFPRGNDERASLADALRTRKEELSHAG